MRWSARDATVTTARRRVAVRSAESRPARDLYEAYTEARIRTAPDYDPTEEYYYLGWKELEPSARRLWWQMAESLLGTSLKPVTLEPDHAHP